MENLVKKLTAEHLETLNLAVQQAQIEYLTTNIADKYSVAVLVNNSLDIQTGYNTTLSSNQIHVHICSQGAEARWEHFAQERRSLDGFLRHNKIVFGNRSFIERLNLLERQFPLKFEEYRQQTLSWITAHKWPADELIDNAIARYQKYFSA